MQIPVLIERLARNGYRAKGLEPFAVSAKGANARGALAKLRRRSRGASRRDRTRGAGSRSAPDPWMEFAGMYKDDPWIDDWVQSMAEYRQQVEDNPDR